MNRQEMQDRLPKMADKITEEVCWALGDIYITLNFDKDDFCKLVGAIGLEKWMDAAEKGRWKRLREAEEMLAAKEQYERDMARLNELIPEQQQLQERVKAYKEKEHRFLAQ